MNKKRSSPIRRGVWGVFLLNDSIGRVVLQKPKSVYSSFLSDKTNEVCDEISRSQSQSDLSVIEVRQIFFNGLLNCRMTPWEGHPIVEWKNSFWFRIKFSIDLLLRMEYWWFKIIMHNSFLDENWDDSCWRIRLKHHTLIKLLWETHSAHFYFVRLEFTIFNKMYWIDFFSIEKLNSE